LPSARRFVPIRRETIFRLLPCAKRGSLPPVIPGFLHPAGHRRRRQDSRVLGVQQYGNPIGVAMVRAPV